MATRAVTWALRHPLTTTAAACVMIVAATAGAIVLGVWLVSFRPDHLMYDAARHEASLVTQAGMPIRTWPEAVPSEFGELVSRPPELGGGRLALVSLYPSSPVRPGTLLAYDVDAGLDATVGSARVEDTELNEYCRDRGNSGRMFGARVLGALDIFEETPGPELVVCFCVIPNSQCVYRIYDLKGKAHFEF